MLQRIKVNLNAVEAMLYFWQSSIEKEKVSEGYLNDLGNMPEFYLYFDEEFTAESLRKVLSAITNREPFKPENKKEGRFWNYNMWVTEDMEYTKAMISPIKQLNLSSLIEKLKDVTDKEELEVVFTPMHVEEYVVKENKLLINFFMVKPGDFDDNTYILGKEIKEYIKEKIQENIKNL